jgi:SNF2 family DNA or RNA helicase
VILHDYQKMAVEFLHGTPRAGLFLDMGLGKTAITLSALTPDHLPALVVAPKRVAEHVWPVERALWRPDLTMALAAGTPAQRQAALRSGADVTVISRDNVADAVGTSYRTVVLDELSSFKARSTNRWKAARRLTKEAAHVWGLTGTPAPNGLLDLWAQIYLLDKGERLGANLTGYRGRYFQANGQLPSGVVIDWRLRPEAEDRIHGLLEDICLYMSSEDKLDLPPVTYNTLKVDLPPAARKHYQTFKQDLVLDMDLLGGEVHSAGNAAVLTNRLSQITAGFIYSDDPDLPPTRIHNAKIEALREVVEGTGSPVLVFYRYKEEARAILEALPQARMLDDALDDWSKGTVPIMLAHPASAGHGLNLQAGGHTIVWTTLTWSLEEWQQANGRLARQGQTHPVVIHTLEVEDTVDPVVADRLATKTFTQSALLDHLRSPV